MQLELAPQAWPQVSEPAGSQVVLSFPVLPVQVEPRLLPVQVEPRVLSVQVALRVLLVQVELRELGKASRVPREQLAEQREAPSLLLFSRVQLAEPVLGSPHVPRPLPVADDLAARSALRRAGVPRREQESPEQLVFPRESAWPPPQGSDALY